MHKQDEAGVTVSYKATAPGLTVRRHTARRQAEAALRAAEQRFQDIVNTTDGIVWEADAKTFTFTFVSKQAERMLGYSIEDWMSAGFWAEHLHPEDKVWAPAYCAALARKMEPHDFEYRFIARDGRTVWLHDTVSVVGEAGQPRWLRGIMVDVTRRKQVEEELRKMTQDLEAKVVERTVQLRMLSAQLTMTEERERRLLAQDLHDNLGQLLAVIKIKLTSLGADSIPAAISQVVDLVTQAELSARMITLQLSPPILHTLGFVPALEWLIDDMERTYGLMVTLDAAPPPPPLVAEMQAMLYRAVRELLINAARHAGVGTASVHCHCTDDQLALVVSDDGRGFDPAQFGEALSSAGAFGLNSINERVTNIGGTMEIDSSPGNGTTITLTVPFAVAARDHSS